MTKLSYAALAVATVLSCGFQGAVEAAENATLNYPPGSAATLTGAFPPIPGIFAVSQTSYSSSNGLYDSKGNKLNVKFRLSAISQTERFLASYPFTLMGANLYTQVVVPYAVLDSKTAGGKTHANGLANITISPVIMNWRVGQFHSITFGFDMMPNSGSYSAHDALNVGSNYSSLSPTLAYRYSDPEGFEFAVASRILYNESNNKSVNQFTGGLQEYHSGDTFVADFNMAYNYKAWKFGVVGGYAQQLTDDKVDGVKAFNAAGVQNGNRLMSLALGPSISYDFGPVQLNVNYQHTLKVENGTKSDVVWANLQLPLWVPAPPPAAPKP